MVEHHVVGAKRGAVRGDQVGLDPGDPAIPVRPVGTRLEGRPLDPVLARGNVDRTTPILDPLASAWQVLDLPRLEDGAGDLATGSVGDRKGRSRNRVSGCNLEDEGEDPDQEEGEDGREGAEPAGSHDHRPAASNFDVLRGDPNSATAVAFNFTDLPCSIVFLPLEVSLAETLFAPPAETFPIRAVATVFEPTATVTRIGPVEADGRRVRSTAPFPATEESERETIFGTTCGLGTGFPAVTWSTPFIPEWRVQKKG